MSASVENAIDDSEERRVLSFKDIAKSKFYIIVNIFFLFGAIVLLYFAELFPSAIFIIGAFGFNASIFIEYRNRKKIQEEKNKKLDELDAISSDLSVPELEKFFGVYDFDFAKKAEDCLIEKYKQAGSDDKVRGNIVQNFIDRYGNSYSHFNFLVKHFSDSQFLFDYMIERIKKAIPEKTIYCSTVQDYVEKLIEFDVDKNHKQDSILDLIELIVVSGDRDVLSYVVKCLDCDLLVSKRAYELLQYVLCVGYESLKENTIYVIENHYFDSEFGPNSYLDFYSGIDQDIKNIIFKRLLEQGNDEFMKFIFINGDEVQCEVLDNFNFLLGRLIEINKVSTMNQILIKLEEDDRFLDIDLDYTFFNLKESRKHFKIFLAMYFKTLDVWSNSDNLKLRIKTVDLLFRLYDETRMPASLVILKKMKGNKGENPILLKKIEGFLKKTEKN